MCIPSNKNIDGRPKYLGNVVGFINNTQPMITKNLSICIFEQYDGNQVVICAIKTIVSREDLLLNCDLNQIEADIVIMWNLCFIVYIYN
jgi:hypothetical protein